MKTRGLIKKHTAGMLTIDALITITGLGIVIYATGAAANDINKLRYLYRDYVISTNLLMQGLELAKTLPTNNALVYPTKKDCWLSLDEKCSGNKAKAANIKDVPNYAISMIDGNWVWQEKPIAFSDPQDKNVDGAAFDKNYQLYIKTDGQMKNYVPYDSKKGDLQSTKFYRSIAFPKIDTITNKTATVEVMIDWQEGTKVRLFRKPDRLYNQLK